MTGNHPHWGAMETAIVQAGHMAGRPELFCPEEVLGQLLKATVMAFDIAGHGEEETQRRALADLLADYVGTPPAPTKSDLLLAAADAMGEFTLVDLVRRAGMPLFPLHHAAPLLRAHGYVGVWQRKRGGIGAERVWRKAVAA